MAHAPGVAYNAQRAKPKAPARDPAAPAPAAAPAAPPTPSGSGGDIYLPNFPNVQVPGETLLEKALVVAGILIVGLGLYSKLTGKPIFLGLQGFNARGAPPAAASYYAQQNRRLAAASDTMFTRMNLANPARVTA